MQGFMLLLIETVGLLILIRKSTSPFYLAEGKSIFWPARALATNPEDDDCSSSYYVFQRSSLKNFHRSSSLCTFESKAFLFLQNKLGGSLNRMIIVLLEGRLLYGTIGEPTIC